MLTLKRLHRWIGLACAMFWFIQALTGVLIVFRWEMDDASIASPQIAVNPSALGERIEALKREGSDVSSMWASGGKAGRFDIFYESNGADRSMRIDGEGNILRDRSDKDGLANGGIWDKLSRVHQKLLGGDFGAWIVGISGMLLLSNLVLGLKLAWPRRWNVKTLTGLPTGKPAVRTHGWHRLLGLWVAFPAIAIVATGIMLVFVDTVERTLGATLEPAQIAAKSASRASIGPGEAMKLALGRYPEATISGVSLPSNEQDSYRIRLNVPGETARIYGSTTVILASSDGAILLDHDARKSRWNRWIVETLYPFHTGQAGGMIGRILQVAIGIWLATMIVLGFRLWLLRRRKVASE